MPKILLPLYGWPHQQAGMLHGSNEMSFRQTIGAISPTDRGFIVIIDQNHRKVIISFNFNAVHAKHGAWLGSVKHRVGLDELNPQPYWDFDELFKKIKGKLHNCLYIQAEVKHQGGKEYFKYTDILMLQKLTLNNFVSAIEKGSILIDFDARTGHNHGTKFRLRQYRLQELYEEVTEIR